MTDATRHSASGDQAASLREKVRRRRRSGLALAVLSGKGGVGKSNLAVNTSVCLAERGLRVALFDLDMALANDDLLMNVQPNYTLAHVVAGVKSIEDILCRGPGGVFFAPGASGMHGLANLSDFERHTLILQMRSVRLSADITVCDLGAGLSRNVLSFANACQVAWVVTTPEPTAIADAYATVKALHLENCPASVQLVVNMADSREEALSVYNRVAGVARKFLNYSVADGGYVLHDTAVELAVQARCPVVIRFPGSNASACIAAIAGELARSCSVVPQHNGWLRRVAGLFV